MTFIIGAISALLLFFVQREVGKLDKLACAMTELRISIEQLNERLSLQSLQWQDHEERIRSMEKRGP